jgi:hypothetical protein
MAGLRKEKSRNFKLNLDDLAKIEGLIKRINSSEATRDELFDTKSQLNELLKDLSKKNGSDQDKLFNLQIALLDTKTSIKEYLVKVNEKYNILATQVRKRNRTKLETQNSDPKELPSSSSSKPEAHENTNLESSELKNSKPSVRMEQERNKNEQPSDANKKQKEVKSDVSSRYPAISKEMTEYRAHTRILKYKDVKNEITRHIDFLKSSNPLYKTPVKVSESIRTIRQQLYSVDIATKDQRIEDSIISFVEKMEDYEENRLTAQTNFEYQTILEKGLSDIDAAILRVNQEASVVKKAANVNEWISTFEEIRAKTPTQTVKTTTSESVVQSNEKLSEHLEAEGNKHVSSSDPQLELNAGDKQSIVDTFNQALKVEPKTESADSRQTIRPIEDTISGRDSEAQKSSQPQPEEPKTEKSPIKAADKPAMQPTVGISQTSRAETKADSVNSRGVVQPKEQDIFQDASAVTKPDDKSKSIVERAPRAGTHPPITAETKSTEPRTRAPVTKPNQNSYGSMFSRLSGSQQAAVVSTGVIGAGAMIGSGIYLGQNVAAVQHGFENALNGISEGFTGTNPHAYIGEMGAEMIIAVTLLIGVAGLICLIQGMIESMSASNTAEKSANHPDPIRGIYQPDDPTRALESFGPL